MAKVSFNNKEQLFFFSVKRSVDEYFKTHQLKKSGNWSLYIKTIVLIPLAISIYLFFLFAVFVNIHANNELPMRANWSANLSDVSR